MHRPTPALAMVAFAAASLVASPGAVQNAPPDPEGWVDEGSWPSDAHPWPRPSPPEGPCVTELGGGMSVQRAPPYGVWQASGFSFGRDPFVSRALGFGRAASGRLIAVVGSGRRLEVRYSDDRGALWRRGTWPAPSSFWIYRPVSQPGSVSWLASGCATRVQLTFDPNARHGIALVRNGELLSTEDEGASWRVRRTGELFAHAWLRGRTLLLLDVTGAIWRSHDLGGSLRTVAGPDGRVEERDGRLVVFVRDRPRYRVDARGSFSAY